MYVDCSSDSDYEDDTLFSTSSSKLALKEMLLNFIVFPTGSLAHEDAKNSLDNCSDRSLLSLFSILMGDYDSKVSFNWFSCFAYCS